MENRYRWILVLVVGMFVFAGQVNAALTLTIDNYTTDEITFTISGTFDADTIGNREGFLAIKNDWSNNQGVATEWFSVQPTATLNTITIGGLVPSQTHIQNDQATWNDTIFFESPFGPDNPIPAGTVVAGSVTLSAAGAFDPADAATLELISGWTDPDWVRLEASAAHMLLASDQNGNLFSVDTITAAGTLIGQETQFPLSTEIEYDPNTGLLYSDETDGSTNLHTIDTSTGLSTGFVSHACCALNGMEFEGTTLYATNNTGIGGSTLVTVDTATGVFTPIGIPESNPVITGLAYDLNTATMFGVTGGGNPAQLVIVDLVTGLASPGLQLFNPASESPLDKVGSIEFGTDGVLYGGMGLNSQLNPGWLFSIDTITGESTFIGPTGLQGITGLTLGTIGAGPMPDLTISKLDSVDPVLAGTELTYTIRVDNIGTGPAADVVVTDTLPAGVTLVSTTGCAEDPTGVPTCSLGTIDAAGFAEYTITVTVDSSTTGLITNNASVTTSSEESNPDNNATTQDTTVSAEADLSITKMDSSDPIISGGNQVLVYTIEVSNAGPSDATNVVVTDTLPSIAIFQTTSGCLNDPNGVPDCQLGTIAAGDSANYTITVSLNRADGTIVNSASVVSDAYDPDSENSSVNETTEVTAIPIPTLGVLGLAALILLLGSIGWVSIRRT